ncbi:hypothetical protein ACMD2_21711 [Ananas comosus]|uniref:Uncharacterized protein n=1 Tax=Ananas comosus TaxID=4615 RepID=A0A199W632_ANACO|nr:hypothetical protein ACMD2_21711 [Ananas comosus]
MLGRADGCGCEHVSPSFSAISASSVAYSPPNPASSVSRIEPFYQFSTTQSTNNLLPLVVKIEEEPRSNPLQKIRNLHCALCSHFFSKSP